MEMKISKLAKLTMPLLASALVACGGSSDSGDPGPGPSPGPIDGLYDAAENEVVIYYKREEAHSMVDESAYEGWGLHLWNGEGCESIDLEEMGIADTGTDWGSPFAATGISETYGAYYVLTQNPDANDPHECMNFILHNGDDKAFGSANSKVQLADLSDSQGVFGFHGSSELFYEPIAERPVAIDGAKAHWLDATTLVWEAVDQATSLELRFDPENGIAMDSETKDITGGTAIVMEKAELSDELKAKFPHLSGLSAASITMPDGQSISDVLKSQIIVVAKGADEGVLAATQVQKPGVIDAVFVEGEGGAFNEELGAIVDGSDVTFKVWAPTAQDVKLYLYNDDKSADGAAIAMTEDAVTGVWSAEESDVVGQFYRYEVTVYHPTTGVIETRMVTDPYSLSLSVNSLYSQVVDMSATDLMPADWEDYERPTLAKDEDHVLYESHIRDFSFSDSRGDADLNGKYLALTEEERESVSHLQDLQDAGLTTLHIMPAFDIATVDEESVVDINDTVADLCAANESAAICSTGASGVIEDVLAEYDPATGEAQALMNDLRALDSFNWGYDPYHYTVPEGSYATDAEGSTRILEFRQMVKATHDMGLKIVMDVVYNHTNASGINQKSVLDKIVPGYYHRRDVNTGGVETSTCCDNTATENLMMGKLMTDSLKVWAEEYNVDGFRFDLMGHQPKDLMVEALAEVREIDPDTIFYGEGWNFGEVANNARFTQATQWEMAGTEIGTFSDRLRDAVRGGSPFDSAEGIRQTQGFGNAAVLNELNADEAVYLPTALDSQDLIRVGMAGNLQDFVILDRNGDTKRGQDVNYNGQKAGYTLKPSENISYVSKHDNQTLWDNNAYKIASTVSAEDRARMQTVSISTVMLGQGIPFIHMGSELLRSKSMQRDSYDSGDWFNRVKFDGSDNNWNVGLPREDKDGANWDLIKQVIADENAEPAAADIELTREQFLDLLKIRSGSELFRLDTADQVKARVDFRNVGTEQTRGLLVMSIDDGVSAGADLDENNDAIVVVINATAEEQSFPIEGAVNFELHEVQDMSVDSVVQASSFSAGTFTVPALTTAVFVQPQGAVQGAGLPVDTDNKDLAQIPPFGSDVIYLRGHQGQWGTEVPLSFVADGVYKATLNYDGEAVFAEHGLVFVRGDSWDNKFEGCEQDSAYTLGEPLTICSGDANSGNVAAAFTEAGLYEVTFDASNPTSPVVTISFEAIASCELLETSADAGPITADLAVRGSHSAWGWDAAYALDYKGNNTYQIQLAAGAYQFKLAGNTDDWDPQVIAYADDARVDALQLDVAYQAWARVGASAIGDPGNNNITVVDPTVLTLTVTDNLVDNQDNGTITLCELPE